MGECALEGKKATHFKRASEAELEAMRQFGRGRRFERKVIVGWLRAKAAQCRRDGARGGEIVAEGLAECLEAGRHLGFSGGDGSEN